MDIKEAVTIKREKRCVSVLPSWNRNQERVGNI